MEANRNASSLTTAVERITNEILAVEFNETFNQLEGNVTALKDVASSVLALQRQSLEKLQVLTDNFGLSTIQIPNGNNLTDVDKNFLRKFIQLQAHRQLLFTALQLYQDEAAPLRASMSTGGRTRILGTGKLARTSAALKGKAAQVKNILKKYNAVIEELRRILSPDWIPSCAIPPTLEYSYILRMDQNDPLWDDTFGSAPWLEDPTRPNLPNTVPMYAKSKHIRDGITAALNLQRVTEQRERLAMENIHSINEWTSSLYRCWECREKHRGTVYSHRLDLALKEIIQGRPRGHLFMGTVLDTTAWNRGSGLWVLPLRSLYNVLADKHPSEQLDPLARPYTPDRNASIPPDMDNPFLTATAPTQLHDLIAFEGDLPDIYEGPTTEAQKLDEDIEDYGIDGHEEMVDSIPLETNLTAGNGSPKPGNTHDVPPIRHLLNVLDGTPNRQPLLPNNTHRLPPISLLKNALAGQRVTMTAERIWGMAAEPALNSPIQRVTLEKRRRYYGGQEILHDQLESLAENRHIDPILVTLAASLLEKEVESSPLSIGVLGGVRPKCRVLCIANHLHARRAILDHFLPVSFSSNIMRFE